MRRRTFGVVVTTVSLLVIVRASHASYNVCGIGLSKPDCARAPIASMDSWPADSPPTFNIGCIGYGTPGDGGPGEPVSYPVTVSGQRFKIEVGGQEVIGGSFVDLHLTCGWPCDADGGWRNCQPASLVRYVGPLVPGQRYRVTWTNGETRDGVSPWCEFTVAASGLVDSAIGSDGSQSVDSAIGSDGGQSVDSTVWPDGGQAVDAAVGIDALVAVVPAVDASQVFDSPSPSGEDAAALPDGGGPPKASSSGCSCSMGGPNDASPGAVLLVALLALASRRRRGADIRQERSNP